MVFQATTRRWRNLAFGLALLPGVAGLTGTASGQAPVIQPGQPTGVQPSTGMDRNGTAKPTSRDPRVLLRYGRDALAANRIEEAQDYARQAEAAGRTTRWGLFEDTPSKLLDAVSKAKSDRDRDEAKKLVIEARKLIETNTPDANARMANLEKAQQMAYKADRLHGPYSVFDVGDRPSRLISDIEAAKVKVRPLVKNTTFAPNANGTLPGAKPAPVTLASQAGQPTNPIQPVAFQAPVAGGPAMPKLDEPKLAPAPVAAPAAPGTMAGLVLPDLDPPSDAVDPAAKTMVAGVVAEARKLMEAGKLVDARGKLTSITAKVSFGPMEDSPEKLQQQINEAGMKQIASLLADAKAKAADKVAAAKSLDAAQALATGLGLDAKIVMDQRVALGLAPATAPGLTIPAPMGTATAAAPAGRGQELLDKARLEMRKGDLEAARRMAIEAFTGNYGVNADAQALLRTIDSEEFSQRRSNVSRSYDAAVTAYNNRDYRQSLSILQQIDPTMLEPQKASAYRELIAKTTMEVEKTARAPKAEPMGGITPASTSTNLPATPSLAAMDPAGKPKSGADTLASQVQAMQEVQFQMLRTEGLKVQSEATSRFSKGETDVALNMMKTYIDKVKAAQIDPNKIALLVKPVEYRMDNLRLLKKEKDAITKETKELREQKAEITNRALNEQNTKEQVSKLMKQFHQKLDEGKYREAQVLAAKARELDPDDPATQAAVTISKIQLAQSQWNDLKERKEEYVRNVLNDADDVGPYITSKEPLKIDPAAMRASRDRSPTREGTHLRTRTEAEKQIEMRLNKPITLKFKGVPLSQVVADLRVMTGLNIVADVRAMEDENISMAKPIDLELDSVNLKSALNILLRQARLTHVIEDNVLKITTEKMARGKLMTKTFSVADLVIPIDNYAIPQSQQLTKVLEQQAAQRGMLSGLNNVPVPASNPIGSGMPALNSSNTLPDGLAAAPGRLINNQAPDSPLAPSATLSNAKNTLEENLMRLIRDNVSPNSWSQVGGAGTIDYYPIGMALVVNQTSDVIEEVYELLEALRRLQDLEVAVEVRIVSLSESFFERIGVDFSMNIKTDRWTTGIEPQLTTQASAPEPFINDLKNAKGIITGLTPAGTLTDNLDIPIRATSFGRAIPPFGGYPNSPGDNGGLSLGLAFLNDIQVFMFMEAAQGDRRINVMQAPKLTLFSGQTSTISIQDVQFFVNNVTIATVNGQVVFIPQNTPLPYGVTVTIQAVVSGDRRFVRLNLIPTLTSLASTNVPLFPITSFITPQTLGGLPGQPVPFTQFVQQPGFTSVQIQTTVSVPDGGTVLLGGLKTLSEGRNEFGPPVLSKIPYVNRAFKNTGYGRDTQSLMLMVTPRIIINSEEETRQTGVVKDEIQP
ncbi:type II secretion system protein GspD [Tuwongella immobilis]|nr:hypothetical protein [Tuwongella immobilis]